jgi:hypothetical protein
LKNRRYVTHAFIIFKHFTLLKDLQTQTTNPAVALSICIRMDYTLCTESSPLHRMERSAVSVCVGTIGDGKCCDLVCVVSVCVMSFSRAYIGGSSVFETVTSEL